MRERLEVELIPLGTPNVLNIAIRLYDLSHFWTKCFSCFLRPLQWAFPMEFLWNIFHRLDGCSSIEYFFHHVFLLFSYWRMPCPPFALSFISNKIFFYLLKKYNCTLIVLIFKSKNFETWYDSVYALIRWLKSYFNINTYYYLFFVLFFGWKESYQYR